MYDYDNTVREKRNNDNVRWWDAIKEPDPDDGGFNYTNFIQGNVKYTDQYADQYGVYDPIRHSSIDEEEVGDPEAVQTNPATLSPYADIISSTNYNKKKVFESRVTVKANRDLVGVTLYCKAEQMLENGGPVDLMRPKVASINLNITRKFVNNIQTDIYCAFLKYLLT